LIEWQFRHSNILNFSEIMLMQGFMDALNDAGFEIAGKLALVFGNGGPPRRWCSC
jgi:hypothetical protein